ncbi:ketohexokinase [Aphelenchoides avenae]|nr:ketohexokinase [Aphelenchus avenae]
MGKILAVGLCCMDVTSYVQKYPAEDSDTRVFDQRTTLGGNIANSASVLAQLNAHTVMFASLPAQDLILAELIRQAGIDASRCIRRPNCKSAVSTCIVNESSGTRTILHYRGNLQEPTAEEFKRTFPNLDEFSWVHFEGRNVDEVAGMIAHVRELRSKSDGPKLPRISLELEKIRPFPFLEPLVPLADVLFVSKEFARSKSWHSRMEAVEGVQSQLGADRAIVICPWGEQGVSARATSIGDWVHVDAHKPEAVVDTLAAGDCFIAACLHYLNEGLMLKEVLEKAVYIAGEKCGQKGVRNLKCLTKG